MLTAQEHADKFRRSVPYDFDQLRPCFYRAERPVWMAPALQGVCEGLAFWSGAVLCPACSRGHGPLALMVSADEVPFCFAGFDALDLTAGCPRPRSDRFAITHMVLATSFARYRAALIDRLILRPLPSRAPVSGRSRFGP